MAAVMDWATAADADLAGIHGVCFDIDDTFSTHGKITSDAFAALWALKNAGLTVVPVTGRPAGWCDHIARFWPVDAVVGENGAFTFFMRDGRRRRIDTPANFTATAAREKLATLRREILDRWPHAEFSSDQAYREFDLAIDVCEDVPAWPAAEVDALLDFCRARGAHAKLSSIHVNTWFGDYDKIAGLRFWLQSGRETGDETGDLTGWIFIGDSPNDEPMFAAFPLSVGVANLKSFLPRLANPPKWLTAGESGAGFVEFVSRILAARKDVR